MKSNGGDPVLILALFCAAAGCAMPPRANDDLFGAAKRNDAAQTEWLLAAGANANGKNDWLYEGLPPLAWAAAWGSVETAEVLIAHGADINGTNRLGTTPLHMAAFYEEPGTVALLIRRGADPNARNKGGGTALYRAMHRLALIPATETAEAREVTKVASVVKLLLESGAQIALADSRGNARSQTSCDGTAPNDSGRRFHGPARF